MSLRSILQALAAGTLVVVLGACGASASPSASTAAEPSVAAPSTEASQAAPSAAEPSSAGQSLAIPSFSLPSEAKDLEALLPNTLCGATATKASVSGASLGSSAGAEFIAGLAALGKTQNDVSFAFAFATNGCGAGIFRIAGVDQGALQTAMLASVQKSGETYSQTSVGGKSVYVSDKASQSGKQYIYFHGDGVIFAAAPDDTKAAEILQALP